MIPFAVNHFSAFFSPTTQISKTKVSEVREKYNVGPSWLWPVREEGWHTRHLPRWERSHQVERGCLELEISSFLPIPQLQFIPLSIIFFPPFFLLFFLLLQSLKHRKNSLKKPCHAVKRKILQCIYYGVCSLFHSPTTYSPPCMPPFTKEKPFFAARLFLPPHSHHHCSQGG